MSWTYLAPVALLSLLITVYLAIGIRDSNLVLTVNAALSLGVALFPAVVELLTDVIFDYYVGFGPEVHIWLAGAALIHTVGMYGLYESVWWWDHLAHTVSATLVAGGVYASLIVLEGHSGDISLSLGAIATLTVLLTFLLGVFWELLEVITRDISKALGKEPMLVPYGRWDTMLDLAFDVFGAVIVIGLDLRLFVELASNHPEVNMWLAYLIVGLSTVGSLALAGFILLYRTIGSPRD